MTAAPSRRFLLSALPFQLALPIRLRCARGFDRLVQDGRVSIPASEASDDRLRNIDGTSGQSIMHRFEIAHATALRRRVRRTRPSQAATRPNLTPT